MSKFQVVWPLIQVTHKNRKQKVYIDGHLTEELQLEAGVPQGSILGPLLYVLFTCDLPEAIHDPEAHPHPSQGPQAQYHLHCQQCGGLCCYADDSTYTKSNTDPVELKKEIDSAFTKISDYMAKNKLVLNGDKTHLMVMSSFKKHKKHGDYGITLNTGNEIIEPSQNEKLLVAF